MSKIIVHNPNNAVHAGANSGVEVRDGGTVLWAGNIGSSGGPITNGPLWKKPGGYGARITKTTATPNRTFKPFGVGEFAHVMVTGSFQVRGLQVELAGQTASGLKLNSGSDFGRRSVHASSGNRRLAISSWSYTTGDATTGTNTGKREEYRVDHEAPPHLSRSLPGEFVYLQGNKIPFQDDYEARTG